MRVVIDTNIFVSSFFGGNPRKVIDLWKKGTITLCLSKAILDEYIEVLERLGLEDEAELAELLTLFSSGYNLLFTTKTPTLKVVVEDPGDDKFIECAVALSAEVVITGDKEVRKIGKYRDIRLMTPREFLEEHERQ